VAEAGPRGLFSLFVLALMLVKELSGENAIQRRQTETAATPGKAYLQVAQKRFDGIHRCC
jgi:hypothetical protein